MDHASVIANWLLVFSQHGLKGEAGRHNHLASFLVKNQITKLEHMSYADHPREWIGAQDITAEEQEDVWNLRRVARRRSR